MLNWLLRYQPIMRTLEELKPTSVLDVGAGPHGLSLYWPGNVVQTDLRFVNAPAARDNATFVGASAEALPFGDDTFDVAISIDMVEHLPAEIRAACMAELFRVARRAVVIAYPIGEVAARADRLMAASFRLRRRPLPQWLAEHLDQTEYPSESLVASALPGGWKTTRVEREHNVWLQFAICLAETTALERITERVERWGRTRRLPQPLKVGGSYRYYFLVERESG